MSGIRRVLRAACGAALVLGLAALGHVAQAQDLRAPDAPGFFTMDPQVETWADVAAEARALVDRRTASPFALEAMRARLVEWRERFRIEREADRAAIATLQAQLDALIPEVAEGEEPDLPPAVAARRAEIETELAARRAPVLLAAEGFILADGLIREIDAVVRERQRARLMVRGPTPLDPRTWIAGSDAFGGEMKILLRELGRGIDGIDRAEVRAALPLALLGGITGLVLLIFGHAWARRFGATMQAAAPRGRGLRAFWVSLLGLVLPLVGLNLLLSAVLRLELLGAAGQTLIEQLRPAGTIVLGTAWLSGRIFPTDPELPGPLGIGIEGKRRGRRLAAGLGWTLAASILIVGLLTWASSTEAAVNALLFPVIVVEAFLLWRLGRLLIRRSGPPPPVDASAAGEIEAEPEPETHGTLRGRGTVLLGRLAALAAIAAPVLAAAGYTAGAQALLVPTILTLAIFATLRVLQEVVTDLYILISGDDEAAQTALTPVLIGLGLLALAMPVLALTWGARVSDLTELWTRFRTGFTIGETVISPTDFLTFAVVFVVLYTATRLLQATLRLSVLPRTKLDVGGRDAIVAGTGYIGIFLAALIAVTTAGLDLSSLAIVAGALSVGIGFGLQTVVSNFVSGIILLIERPISQGDWIEVGGVMGYVREISVRSTRIETFDRTDVIIPNADLVAGQVTNWTRGNNVGRLILPVGVAYGTDTARVSAILSEIAEAHPQVTLNPRPFILFKGFGADSLDFEIRAILRDVNWVLSVQSEMNHAIARRFAEEGIEIPFAQRDIWLRNPEVLRPGGAGQMPAAAGPGTAHLDAADMPGEVAPTDLAKGDDVE